MYKFRISIGDWSGDGHGRHEDFIVSSNVPVEQIREAHYAMKDITGINIEDICAEYEEYEVDEEVITVLENMGFHFENGSGMGEEVMDASEMARLWIFL